MIPTKKLHEDGARDEARLFAQAIWEIRVLLSGYLGSGAEEEVDMDVRQAAHLAYALHEDALNYVAGLPFDQAASIRRIAAVDGMLGSHFREQFERVSGAATGD